MSPGGQVHDTSAGTDRARFVTVMRGYDRIEVDEYVRDARRTTQRLQAELAQSEERRRRAEQHAESVEREMTTARSRPAAPAEEGFGMRAERRPGSRSRRRPRSAPARRGRPQRPCSRPGGGRRARHQPEQPLITRSSRFDEQAAQCTVELQQREQQIAEQSSRAERGRGRRGGGPPCGGPVPRTMQADEKRSTRELAQAGQIRDQAAQALARLTGLQDNVRAELARLATLLTQESARAPGGEGEALTANVLRRGNSMLSATPDATGPRPGRAGCGDGGRPRGARPGCAAPRRARTDR